MEEGPGVFAGRRDEESEVLCSFMSFASILLYAAIDTNNEECSPGRTDHSDSGSRRIPRHKFSFLCSRSLHGKPSTSVG